MSAEPERRESFGRAAARIAVPAALQSMLQASFGAIDQLMIGQLGSVSVAGVGLAGKLGSAVSVVVAAVAGVSGVMMAQALGRGDRPEARRGFALGLAASLTVAGAAAAACGLWPGAVMRLYTDDAQTAAAAACYLRVLSLSFLPSAGMAMLAALLRCMELASLPLLASAAAALLNTGLNWALIFGHLGAPAMGAAGAAEAVVCLLALQHGVIPPTANLLEPDPECDLDYTPVHAVQAQADLALSNSLGFGGHNACLVFRKV